MKVYLDDERLSPIGWSRVFWPNDSIELLKSKKVTHLSLDHDLGDDDHGTGYDVLLWLEEQVIDNNFTPIPIITIHTDNPSARIKMKLAVDSINKRRI